jgi:DNA topoisomerase IA
MNAGDPLTEHGIAVEQHFTEPPPRYTEATLIKKMEELGIGRPSTYTATLSVLRDRGYVRLAKKQLIPEDKGRLVTASSKASSAATSNTTSPPTSRRSWTSSPLASSNGRTCCAISGASSSAR